MVAGPVKIFSVSDTPRLRYVAEILLGDMLGLSWEIVTEKRKLGKTPVINYSDTDIRGAFRIAPDSLLFESGAAERELKVTEWKGLPVFFLSPEGYDLPFDIFAASFYLISRYEEYLDFAPDKFGRFCAGSSFSFRNGFLRKPVVDLWCREWAKVLVVKFQNLVFRKNTYHSAATFDLDQPFEYLGKDFLRNIGGFILGLGKKTGRNGDRYRTLARGEKDPWDVFDYIFSSIENSGSDAMFFVPTGDRSEYDRQPSWNNDDYRKLIRKVIRKYKTGLHPSFYASDDPAKLKNEIARLKKITGEEVISSRFHFVRIKFPVSYRILEEAGIKEDYSMGYHDEPGFRAGLAGPFFFYNLEEERKTNLRVFPFQLMDATLYQYKKMDHSEAGKTVSSIIEETRKSGGTFISIWHNTSLTEQPECKEWRQVFENMLTEMQ